jgi:hypothetical protein
MSLLPDPRNPASVLLVDFALIELPNLHSWYRSNRAVRTERASRVRLRRPIDRSIRQYPASAPILPQLYSVTNQPWPSGFRAVVD